MRGFCPECDLYRQTQHRDLGQGSTKPSGELCRRPPNINTSRRDNCGMPTGGRNYLSEQQPPAQGHTRRSRIRGRHPSFLLPEAHHAKERHRAPPTHAAPSRPSCRTPPLRRTRPRAGPKGAAELAQPEGRSRPAARRHRSNTPQTTPPIAVQTTSCATSTYSGPRGPDRALQAQI